MSTFTMVVVMFMTGAVCTRFCKVVDSYKGTRRDIFSMCETGLEVLALAYIFKTCL